MKKKEKNKIRNFIKKNCHIINDKDNNKIVVTLIILIN